MLNINRKIKSGNILRHLKFKLESVKSERFVRLRLLTSGTNKSNFIKMLSVLLVLSLLSLISLLPILSSRAYAETYPSLNGITYLNMPEKTFGGKTTECKLTITNLNLNNNKLNLSGILSYSSRNYYLNIEGTLYKSRIGKDNFVALAKDTTNTFNVLHLSILFNPNPHFLITKRMKNELSKPNASFNHSPIITVYLQRKGTREISFAEGNIGTEEKLSHIVDNIESSKITASLYCGDDLYYTSGVFLPILSRVKTLETSYGGGQYLSFEYSETYVANNYGDTYTYFIDYNITENGASSIRMNNYGGNYGEFTFDVKIQNKGTRSTNPIYSSTYSPFLIGGPNDPVIIKAKAYANNIADADRLIYAKYKGHFFKYQHWYSGLSISVGLSVGAASISWNPSQLFSKGRYIPPNTEIYLDNNNNGLPARLSVHSYEKLYLKEVNDDFVTHIIDQPDKFKNVIDRHIDGKWIIPIYAKYSVLTPYSHRTTKIIYTSKRYKIVRS